MGGDAVVLIFLLVLVGGLLYAVNRALSQTNSHSDEARGPR